MAELVNTEKANKPAERLLESTRDSYGAAVEGAIALQDRNIRFAQDMLEVLSRQYRQQTEDSQALAQELIERAEEQREALQSVVEESLDAYMDLLYAPLSYYKEGFEVARKAVR